MAHIPLNKVNLTNGSATVVVNDENIDLTNQVNDGDLLYLQELAIMVTVTGGRNSELTLTLPFGYDDVVDKKALLIESVTFQNTLIDKLTHVHDTILMLSATQEDMFTSELDFVTYTDRGGVVHQISTASRIERLTGRVADVDQWYTEMQQWNQETATNKTAVESLLDQFDDRYLGAKSVEPTTDNDGDPLIVGAFYSHVYDDNGTQKIEMRIWDGSKWDSPDATATQAAQTATTKAGEAAQSATDASNTKGEVDTIKGQIDGIKVTIDQSESTISGWRTEISQWRSDVSGWTYTVNTKHAEFTTSWLGTYTDNPTLDNSGNALKEGAMYLKQGTNALKIYSSDSWKSPIEDAYGYREFAKRWAIRDRDVEVESGEYSAKHHALVAGDYSTAAAASATNASDEAIVVAGLKTQVDAATAEAKAARDQAVQAVNSVTSPFFFAGDWDASTGQYPPPPADGVSGNPIYRITVAGTINSIEMDINDELIWNNTEYYYRDNSDSVVTVAGKKGVVTLEASDIAGLNIPTPTMAILTHGRLDEVLTGSLYYQSTSDIAYTDIRGQNVTAEPGEIPFTVDGAFISNNENTRLWVKRFGNVPNLSESHTLMFKVKADFSAANKFLARCGDLRIQSNTGGSVIYVANVNTNDNSAASLGSVQVSDLTDTFIFSFVYDKAANKTKIYINGEKKNEVDTTGIVLKEAAWEEFYFGGNFSSASASLDGSISTIRFYDVALDYEQNKRLSTIYGNVTV